MWNIGGLLYQKKVLDQGFRMINSGQGVGMNWLPIWHHINTPTSLQGCLRTFGRWHVPEYNLADRWTSNSAGKAESKNELSWWRKEKRLISVRFWGQTGCLG